ncbi:MAG: hypothetical protein EOO39_43570 [Cytophagaceae bacterium]|nr:MAG: hypothetical protein EOO39_43570 [Cytophagaceae bacterium]
MVAQFHYQFNSPVLGTPQIPEFNRTQLRVDLITEELDELIEAIVKRDLVAIADALCDLQYVLSGAILEFGMSQIFGQLFSEVHRSNMSKACVTEQEAEATVAHYKAQNVKSYFAKYLNDTYNVYRLTDNKTLKSVNYSPADLLPIIEKAQQ